jgi:hypothetical protein
MVHPPRNPTGNLSSSFSGNLSPVIAIPRTIQKAKIASYSASFHMAHMEGSYSGIDTMYLKTNNTIQSVNSTLGWWQDVLSFTGRSDVRAYTSKRYSNMLSLGSIGRSLEKYSQRYPYTDEMKAYFLLGSSFVGLNQSVKMQSQINDSPPETGIKYDRHDRPYEVQFRGFYPRLLVYAHPALSKAGCRPPQPPSYSRVGNTDNRCAWFLSSMMLLIPEFWNAVSNLPNKDQQHWEGNVLTFLTVKCLEHISPTGTKGSPF